MNKKPHVVLILLFAISSIMMTSCSTKEKAASPPAPKPNIIYILADDLGYGDLSCYGQTKFQTPHIDSLANLGMKFTQHYSGSTVCAPSRSSLMTGQHTGHTDIRGNKEHRPEGQMPMDSSTVTVAELLKRAGYITGAFGKWGLGYPGSEGDPNFQGFDEFYGYNCQRIGHHYYPYYMWFNQSKDILTSNKGKEEGTYGPDIIHKHALDFIEKNKDTSFFMYYPSIIPHAELKAPEKYIAMFRDKLLPEKKYEGVDEGQYFRQGNYGSQKECHAAFAAMITVLDEQVGEIVAKVKELGIADNTIIIFSSDNGPHTEGGADPEYFDSNDGLRGVKRDLYEGGIRVPMIAYWPNKIKAGQVSNHVSAFWDFLPTACDLAHAPIPENTDGISFLPELLGKEQKKHGHLYWEFHEQGGKQAVLLNNWKGVRVKMANAPEAPIELYDLSNDIGEQNNVATEHPDIVQKIDSIMRADHVPSEKFKFKFEESKNL